MKIVSFMCVYNDHEYLDQAIESFKNYPDKLFIIEGSWQSSQKYKASPRSNDLTNEIINKHVDNERVVLIKANEPREREQRQIGLDLAKEEKADWCHMLDADEVYKSTSLKLIRQTLECAKTNKQTLGFTLNSYNFINSFKKWYEGKYKRIYRVTPSARFYMDNDVRWLDCDTGVTSNIQGKSFYHYNYVKRNTEAFWLKMKYQNDQDPTLWKRMVESGQYKEENGVYKIPDDCKIYDFAGKHPKIMEDHPYFKNDIFKDGVIEYE